MARSDETSDFWDRLMLARKTAPRPLGLRQEDVAKSADTKFQSAVTKWKTGKGLPTTRRARILADEAGVSFDWLMTGRGEMRPAQPAPRDPYMEDLAPHWRVLTPESKKYLVSTAEMLRRTQFTGDATARAIHEQKMVDYTAQHQAMNVPLKRKKR